MVGLEAVLELHDRIKDELDLVEIDYKQLGDVFERLQDGFLAYAVYSSQQTNASNGLVDRMNNNEEIADEIEKLETGKMLSAKEKTEIFGGKFLTQTGQQKVGEMLDLNGPPF